MESRILPIMVQPLTLFPGQLLPIRVENASQHAMVKDITATDKLVGVVVLSRAYFYPDFSPRAGTVGCLAKLVSVKKLPNGAYRVVYRGESRFSITRMLPGLDPYLRAEITPYEDMPESLPLLTTFADDVRLHYERYVRANEKVLKPAKQKLKAKPVPDDPIALSFHLPAVLGLDVETSERFMASRSPLMRLRELSAILEPSASVAERSAEMPVKSKTNGQGAKSS